MSICDRRATRDSIDIQIRLICHKGEPVTRMLNSAGMRAPKTVELPQVRVHDLKHTFGRCLRAAGVSFEDRQDLLGHRSARITTHYSAVELSRLPEAANSVCSNSSEQQQLEIVVLRRSCANWLLQADHYTAAEAG